MGQRARLHRMFIVFRPNSIVSATEMAFFFFENFHFSDFFSCIGIQVRANLWSFSIGNGSTAKCPSEVLYLSAKFHRFGSEMAFFLKIFISVSFFFASEFRFTQICEAFQLEKGQRPRVHQRFIVFCQIPSFRPPKWHFFENLRFGAQFFYFIFAPKFKFTQIGATFRLEIG